MTVVMTVVMMTLTVVPSDNCCGEDTGCDDFGDDCSGEGTDCDDCSDDWSNDCSVVWCSVVL